MNTPALLINNPGPRALIQDRGRFGFSTVGVSPSGSFDRLSAARANHAVGNDANAPLIEILFGNFSATALSPITIIVTGTDSVIEFTDGTRRKTYTNTVIDLQAGDKITLLPAEYGLRSYLAIRGGIAADTTLGSASSDTLSGIGPSPLLEGDVVSAGSHIAEANWWPMIRKIPPLWRRLDTETLHVIMGPRADWFTQESIAAFLSQTYTVTTDSDRVGIRVTGEIPLVRARAGELASEGMVRGSIQIPPNGQPVIFGPDHPVTGGYPVIAVLTSRSCDRSAQLAPGSKVTFRLGSYTQ